VIPNIWLWFYHTNLNVIGLHVVIPEKQFTETGRINLGDIGEIQYDVVTPHFFGSQDRHLYTCFVVTIKSACEGEDFCLVMLSFTNLKHKIYLTLTMR
jgi:hypothetical protein